MVKDLSNLPDKEKLFRLSIGLKLVASETTDEKTGEQIMLMLEQLGLK